MQPGTNEEMDVGTISTHMYTYGWGWSTPTNLSSVAFWHFSKKREQFWSETRRKKSHSKYSICLMLLIPRKPQNILCKPENNFVQIFFLCFCVFVTFFPNRGTTYILENYFDVACYTRKSIIFPIITLRTVIYLNKYGLKYECSVFGVIFC